MVSLSICLSVFLIVFVNVCVDHCLCFDVYVSEWQCQSVRERVFNECIRAGDVTSTAVHCIKIIISKK